MPQSTVSAALHWRLPKQPELLTEISICFHVLPAPNLPHPNSRQWSATTRLTAALPGVEWSGSTSKATLYGQAAPLPTVPGISNSLMLANQLLVSLAASTAPTTTGKISSAQLHTPTEATFHCGMLTTTAMVLSQTSIRSVAGPSHGQSSTSETPLCAVWTSMSTSFQVNEQILLVKIICK